MIVAAGLLVLVGLGLFVAGVLTGVTTLYWACVGACVVAAGLLFLARRRMTSPTASSASAAPPASAAPAATSAPAAPAAPPAPAAVAGTPVVAAAPEEERRGRHAGGDVGDSPPSAVAGNGVAGTAGNGVAGTAAAPGTASGGATVHGTMAAAADAGDPPVEEVEVTDLLLVVDLKDEVLVVDEHPRYHVPGCRHLGGRESIPIPLDEARTDGFTPCGICRPDATLADRVRATKLG